MTSRESGTNGRLPRGPHQLAPEEIAANQRRRLREAMVELVGAQGYVATPVADLIEHAGISRRTFYELYTNREALLKETFELTAQYLLSGTNESALASGGMTRQLEKLTRQVCHSARDRPGALALCAVEIAAADSEGFVLRDGLIEEYAKLIRRCVGYAGEDALPQTIAIALAGALEREICAYLLAGRAGELGALAPQLARWMRSYCPAPPALGIDAPPASPPSEPGWSGRVGGRAPGTLTLAPDGYLLQAGRPSPGLILHANRERILDAVAQLSAMHGYSELTVEAIAEQAELPEHVFRASFKDKDESFATAVELGHTKGQAIVDRARAASTSWREGVRNAVHALLEFLASEPHFTRLAFVEAPLAGPGMARRTDEHAGAYAQLLLDGAPQRRKPPPVAAEAILQGLVEIVYRHAAQDIVSELPRAGDQLTYLALAPFLGPAEAAAALAR